MATATKARAKERAVEPVAFDCTQLDECARWFDLFLRRYPPRSEPGPARIEAPCVPRPSQVTVEALGILDVHLLYQLLLLHSASATDVHRARQGQAKLELKQHEEEARRWRAVSKHLGRAVYLAERARNWRRLPHQLHPEPGKELPADVLEFAAARGYRSPEDVPGRRIDILELPAINVLFWWAQDARRIADEITGEESVRGADGEVVRRARRSDFGISSPIPRTKHFADMSPKVTAQFSRQRLQILVTTLRATLGWTHAKVAELIIASQTDWDPPPLDLPIGFRTDPLRLTRWVDREMRAYALKARRENVGGKKRVKRRR